MVPASGVSERIERDLEALIGVVERGELQPEPLDRPDLAPEPHLTCTSGYRLLERLGSGGMGEVWRARHVELNTEVAIKRLQPRRADDPRMSQWMVREGLALAKIRHPNVVRVHDVGQQPDGAVVLVMELLEGSTLGSTLRREGPLPWLQARAVLLDIAQALACTHVAGVIHRDLKPDNVLLCEEVGKRRAVLIDFGLARVADAQGTLGRLTLAGELLGTPRYLAPEVIRGRDPSPQSDIYAFGCLAYELLTGRHPFEGRGLLHMLSAHLLDTPPELDLPGTGGIAVARLLRSTLAKRPEERPPSADTIVSALLAASEDPAPPRRLAVRRLRVVALLCTSLAAGAGLAQIPWVQAPRTSSVQVTPLTPRGPFPAAPQLAGWRPRSLLERPVATSVGVPRPARRSKPAVSGLPPRRSLPPASPVPSLPRNQSAEAQGTSNVQRRLSTIRNLLDEVE